MHSVSELPIKMRFTTLSVSLGLTQIQFLKFLGLSKSSLSRMKTGNFKNLPVVGLLRVLNCDPNIIYFLLCVGQYESPHVAYVADEETKLSIHKTICEIEGGYND